MSRQVVCEGYADQTLLQFLGFSNKQIIKEGARGKVIAKLKALAAGSKALVDEDPKADNLPKDLRQIPVKSDDCQFKWMDIGEKRVLVMISPLFDEWLLWQCKLCKLDISKYGLSSNKSKLAKELKSPRFQDKLIKLLEALQEADRSCLDKLKKHLS